MNCIRIQCDGYVNCRSSFYTALNVLHPEEYCLSSGVNILRGDIDSGVWAISYLLSMYHFRKSDFVLQEAPVVTVDDEAKPLKAVSGISCYLDRAYPLFRSSQTVRSLIEMGIKKTGAPFSLMELQDLFHLDAQRIDRKLHQCGNEGISAMSAIGVAYSKQVFCFPWFSDYRLQWIQPRLQNTATVLADLGKTVILPLGSSSDDRQTILPER